MSTLLAARAFAKAGHVQYAWQALESLFAVQATNGIMPKYRYSPSNNTQYFINHTDIPSQIWFQDTTYMPPTMIQNLSVHSSGRLSALPLHASLILELFYLSNQTKTDAVYLQHHFERLFQQHDVIHSVVMRGCHALVHHPYPNKGSTIIPCYNVVHPWETLLQDDSPLSPLWKEALTQTKILIQKLGWKPPIHSPHHDEASLFLLECMSNATDNCTTTVECEDNILQKCPFAMLDIGYAAALSKSDEDLIEMARILQELKMDPSHQLPNKLVQLQAWKQQSAHVLNNLLWNEQYQTYLSRYIVFDNNNNNDNNSVSFMPRESKWLEYPVATNFMALWSTLANESRRNAMTFHMLQHVGRFAFDCGPYPLVSSGDCKNDTVTISPVLNYLVSRGLQHNNATSMSYYIVNSTLNLVCGLPNTLIHTQHHCPTEISFYNAYHGESGLPVIFPEYCGETATAASIYNFLLADKSFKFTPAPPIGSRWIIALVVAELVVAFVLGVSCVLLNLYLLKRVSNTVDATHSDGLWRGQESEGDALHYFSAAASLEEAIDDEDEDDDYQEGVSS